MRQSISLSLVYLFFCLELRENKPYLSIIPQSPFDHLKNPRPFPPPVVLRPSDHGREIATHVRDAPAVDTVTTDLVRDIHGPLEAGIASAHDSLSEVVETVVHVGGSGVLVAQVVSEESVVADAKDVLFFLTSGVCVRVESEIWNKEGKVVKDLLVS